MKKPLTVVWILIFLAASNVVIGQSLLNQYENHPKTENDFDLDLVPDKTIHVSTRKPLVIKSPNKTETFKIYTFTKIWDNGKFKAFVGLSENPFKPNLVTTNKKQTQITKIQLLGNHGQNRADYEVVEEVRISNDQDIILVAKLYTWTLNNKGEKIKESEKVDIKIDKYRINEKGELEKI